MKNRFIREVILATVVAMAGVISLRAQCYHASTNSPSTLASSPTPRATPYTTTAAQDNILALNRAMMPIYDNELSLFQADFLKTHPIIVARFDGAGGQFTLFRPGQPPLKADEAPIIYQLVKSVGHSAMVTFDMAAPYINADSSTWKPQMQGFQTKIETALSTLDQSGIQKDDQTTVKDVLTTINDFLKKCLADNKITQDELTAYGLKCRPFFAKLIKVSAYAQAHHDMAILAEWKKLLGDQWKETYAITNTMMVTRQNNLLFSMLAEFMGRDSINHHLYMFETTSFETTDNDLINLLIRSLNDNKMGKTMLGNYWAMNTELLSNGGTEIIAAEAKHYGLPMILPDKEPFNSTDWPWRHNSKEGSGPAELFLTK